MRIRVICCLPLILICFLSFSQEKIKFKSNYIAGIASGKSGGYGIIQTVNGVKYKEWFTGIGVGIDYYKYKTIPLFIDIKTSLPKTNFFGFADFGYNFSSNNKPGKEIYYYNSYHFSGGVYNEVGVGYKVKLNPKSHLVFTSGYSYKELNNKVGAVNPCLTPPCPMEYSRYEYGYGRIVFKAGVSL